MPASAEDRSADARVRYRALVQRVRQGLPMEGATSRLVEEALAVWTRPGFETFIALPRLRFEPLPHQLAAAATALRQMRGRVILADEVGLGKTIEAALVLSELRLRGLAQQVLVLTPTGLVEQWQEELDRKFALPSLVVSGTALEPELWTGAHPVVIASLATARRTALRDVLTSMAWDLVIADEAHHLKNPHGASALLVRGLRSRYLLLLTATPVENRLEDLFHLVSLVRPGHLGTLREFRARHGIVRGAGTARNVAELHSRTRGVMIRHRRSELARQLPRRLAETLRVVPPAAEAELYRRISAYVREQGRRASPGQVLALQALQRAAGSSPAALVAALEHAGGGDLLEAARHLPPPEKSRRLVAVIERHRARGERVIVFTAFRPTLGFLATTLAAEGIPHAVYHGSLPRTEKERAVRRFEVELDVLLSTEAGGEGRNLQCCHAMVNYDLPWNPMRIEQRLGRIHRIGQDHEVLLTNLVGAGTIEDHILRVLEARINLFELVVGELDMILGRVGDDFDFETEVFRAHVASAHEGEFEERLVDLGEQLGRARDGYLDSRRRIDELVSEADAP